MEVIINSALIIISLITAYKLGYNDGRYDECIGGVIRATLEQTKGK